MTLMSPEYELIPSDDRNEERHQQLDSDVYHKSFHQCSKVTLLVVLCIVALACWKIFGNFQLPSVPQNTRKVMESNNTVASKGKYSVG